jgi:hypothetical protein
MNLENGYAQNSRKREAGTQTATSPVGEEARHLVVEAAVVDPGRLPGAELKTPWPIADGNRCQRRRKLGLSKIYAT